MSDQQPHHHPYRGRVIPDTGEDQYQIDPSKHDEEDEMFWVIKGCMKMELRDQTLTLHQGDFTVIPKGVEHKPSAENETHILMFEPIETLNTGDGQSSLTVEHPQKI